MKKNNNQTSHVMNNDYYLLKYISIALTSI